MLRAHIAIAIAIMHLPGVAWAGNPGHDLLAAKSPEMQALFLGMIVQSSGDTCIGKKAFRGAMLHEK